MLLLLRLLAAVAGAVAGVAAAAEPAYINASFYTLIGFGGYSAWLQPWRAYAPTLPVGQLGRALGIVFSPPPGVNEALVAQVSRLRPVISSSMRAIGLNNGR